MPVCQPTCLHERLAVQGFDEQRERGKRSFSSLLILQSWLNWYSIGLENRQSERISGFESLALRLDISQESEEEVWNIKNIKVFT